MLPLRNGGAASDGDLCWLLGEKVRWNGEVGFQTAVTTCALRLFQCGNSGWHRAPLQRSGALCAPGRSRNSGCLRTDWTNWSTYPARCENFRNWLTNA